VAEPVEGTILTVARESVENIVIDDNITAEKFFYEILEEMKKSLEHTPELLAALKEAGVIDSGGAGLVYIIEGFYKALTEEDAFSEMAVSEVGGAKKSIDLTKFNENSVMEFGYCTEFLLQLTHAKTDIEKFSVKELIDFLGGVGDSIVAFITGTVVKVHVHTMEPWRVLQHCQQFGEFLTLKIENMTLQHNETSRASVSDINKKVKKSRKKFAVVTVATGQGLINTFKDMGADYVVSGGQTNNPSSEDFIAAFEEVNADHVFVLPNNSNIILTAKQAADMYEGSDIRVIESKTIGAGYSALSMLDYESDDADAIESELKENMKNSVTGMLTKAVRTTTVNGVEVNKDDYIGFTNKLMLVSTPEKMKSVYALADKIITDERMFLIVSYGKGATVHERQAFRAFMAKEHSELEFYEIDGEQDVYDFILIVE